MQSSKENDKNVSNNLNVKIWDGPITSQQNIGAFEWLFLLFKCASGLWGI